MTQRLIDAHRLLEELRESCRWHAENGREFSLLQRDIRIVREQPTIDAEPVRHGMFIGTESDGYADGYPVYYEWKCSECGCIFEEEEPTYRYCPNCGARMDKEDDTKGD